MSFEYTAFSEKADGDCGLCLRLLNSEKKRMEPCHAAKYSLMNVFTVIIRNHIWAIDECRCFMCVLEWWSCPDTITPASRIYTGPREPIWGSNLPRQLSTAAHRYSFINVWFWLIALSGVLIGKTKPKTCEMNCTKSLRYYSLYCRQGMISSTQTKLSGTWY